MTKFSVRLVGNFLTFSASLGRLLRDPSLTSHREGLGGLFPHARDRGCAAPTAPAADPPGSAYPEQDGQKPRTWSCAGIPSGLSHL